MKKNQSKSTKKTATSKINKSAVSKPAKKRKTTAETPPILEPAVSEAPAVEISDTIEVNQTTPPDDNASSKAKKTNKPKDEKPKRISALDAAAQVLRDAKAPMRCKEMITAMQTQGLWASPNGKTPEATLYSAILREVNQKGDQSRFRKLDRGLFEANA